MNRSDAVSALRTSLPYVLVSAAWLIASSQATAMFAQDRHLLALAETVKGVGFIFLTALLIFHALLRETVARRRCHERLQRSEEVYRLERREMLETLYVGAQRLSENLDMRALCQALTQTCVEKFNVALAWIGSAEPDGRVAIQAHYPPGAEYLRSISIRWDSSDQGRGPVGRAIRSGRAEVASHIAVDPEVPISHEHAMTRGLISIGVFPLISSHGTLGSLTVYSEHADYFTPQRIEFFQAFSCQVAAAMENVALYAELKEHAAHLEQRVTGRATFPAESNNEMNALVDLISQDLRAPLRGIQRFPDTLSEDYEDGLDADGGDYLLRIRRAANRMDTLIQDLLAYSKAGRAGSQVGSTNLADVIDAALDQLEAELRAGRAQILVQAPMYEVMAHAPTLAQMVASLLSNAVKFVAPDADARVRVWSEDRGRFVRLWVEDNGIGIAADDQKRIFHAFERLHGAETYSGNGIGLAIVQRGAERMGGSAGVDSVPGSGSRFWLELPRG